VKKGNQVGAAKQNSKQEIESEVTEEYMVKHVREMIHRVGSYDKFRKIVYKAVTTESSSNTFKKLKTMHGAHDIRAGD
jgi:chorismate mutase